MNRFFLLTLLTLLMACQQDPDPADRQQAEPEAQSTTPTAHRPNPWKNAGCELVTDTEVAELFHFEPYEATLNTRTLPDKGFCLRSWNKPDWKERESNNEKVGANYLEPKNTLVLQVFDYGTPEIAAAQFDIIKKDRRNTYEKDVPGLGDDAVWSSSTTTLVVKHEHLVLNVTLEHKDSPIDNLPMAKKVAEIALNKM
ncbi:MAG: hypothetical protein R2792_15710 [Saprospiraceae bacterium]